MATASNSTTSEAAVPQRYDVMETVVGLPTAYAVWKKLETTYNTSTTPHAAPMNTNTGKKSVGAYFPLCTAIENRDWKKTKEILDKDPDALTDILNVDGDTALHLAIGQTGHAFSRHLNFLEELLKRIDPEMLPSLVNNKHQNTLHYAAMLNDRSAAWALVGKNPDLLFMADGDKYLPITTAAFHSQRITFLRLFYDCKDHIKLCQEDGYHRINPFEGEYGALLLTHTIYAGFFDKTYDLLHEHPELVTLKAPGSNMGPLWSIAQKWDAFPSGQPYNFYQRFVYRSLSGIFRKYTLKWKTPRTPRTVLERIHDEFWDVASGHVPHIRQLYKDKLKHYRAYLVVEHICDEVGKLKSSPSDHYEDAFLVAVENDTPEVIERIIQTFPQSIWGTNDVNGYTVPQISVMNRCEKIYSLLVHKKTLHNSITDKDGNNLLHLAGKLAPQHKLNKVTGAALQMQRELQWFKEVSNLLRQEEREQRNKNKETPIMVFRKEHTDLRQRGEAWMKKTADSYTITAALIITIVFAAAITIPGGNGENGQAIYRERSSFIIFIVSDAISLFTSTTSLLLFLSILTARYADEDFLYKLPKRLIFGLVMLFMSVTAMMIAFSATLYIMFEQDKSWVLIPIVALTCLPIASFVTLQLPLLVDLIYSTYGHGIFGRRELKIETVRQLMLSTR